MVVYMAEVPSEVPKKVQEEGSGRDSLQVGWHNARISAAQHGVSQPIEDRDDGVAAVTNSTHDLARGTSRSLNSRSRSLTYPDPPTRR